MPAALYSQTIKNLVQGVSQQPSFIRYPEQLEEQVNGFSTEVDGLQKRPPTVFLKKLAALQKGKASNMLVHFINRDTTEKYMMVFTNNQIYVYDLDGNQHAVAITSGTAGYLSTNNPRKDLQVITIADHTFVLNRTKTVRMSSTKSPNNSGQGTIVVVKNGQYGNTYTINGKSYTTPDGSQSSHVTSIRPERIAASLASAVGGGASASHNYVFLPGAKGATVGDGYGGSAMVAIYDTAQKYTDLPYYAPNGFTVKVKGDPNGGSEGSYYVKYNNSKNVWEECVAPNLPISLDAHTMPHKLVRNADGTFTFDIIDWDERRVGDDDSNPLPSFVDNTLTNIFFYRNRLGLSSKENIILSESGSYYNWWMTTANDILDTDCIDVPVTSTKVNLINYMVVYMEDLYAFSDDTQFIVRSDTTLTPKTASPVEITQFNSSPDCQPVVTGKNLYFATERGTFASIKEYYTLQDVSAMKNAQDISSHVPNYVPQGVYQIVPSTTENILLVLSDGDKKALYVYKYLFSDTTRVQASWSKWTFDGDVVGCGFIGSKLYLLLQRGNHYTLEAMDFSTNIKDNDTEPYRVLLDQKKVLTNGVFDTMQEVTAFNLRSAYGYSDDTAWADGVVDVVDSEGVYYPQLKVTNGKITLDGKFDDMSIIVGSPYLFHIMFSTFYIKQQNTSGTTARAEGRTQLKYINLQYDHSGYFNARVHQKSGMDFSYAMTSYMLGVSAKLGEPRDDTGIFRFPVHAKNDEVEISIDSDYPLPLSLIGLTWECMYTTKTRRV